MKALLFSAFLMVGLANLASAQTQNNRDTTNRKSTTGKKNTTTQNNTGNNRRDTMQGRTGTGNTGNVTNTNQQGNTNMNNNMATEGGQMSSTGRYAAMGVQAGNLHRKDVKFTVMANSSNMMELQLSQMATQKATNAAVKDFANMMVQHHTMAAQEMKQLLSSKGAQIPDSAMLPMHRMRMEMLQNLQGADFDKAYMRIMVDAHEEDVDEYEDEVTDANDADIRAFASKMLPTLRQHYARSKEVRKQL